MEEEVKQENISTEESREGSMVEKKIHPSHLVHSVLAHSYLVYFLLLFVGVGLDLIFPIRIFHNGIMIFVGFIFLILATFLVIWAQHSSKKFDPKNVSKEAFCRGPYCYTRTPTHWGLFFLVLGFGFIMNAFFIITLTIISFIITKLFFLKKQESILADKYGKHYEEYKKSVKI